MDINSMSGGYEPNRVTGLASGLDTDALIKKMLTPDQMEIDRVKQDEQRILWKQEQMGDIIKDLKDFNNYFDILSPNNLVSSKNYAGTVAKSSDENQVQAQTFAGAVKGTYKVYVNTIAKPAMAQAELKVGTKKATSSDTLASLGITKDNLKGGLEFDINGAKFKLEVFDSKATDKNKNKNTAGIKEDDSISDLIEKIKNLEGTVNDSTGKTQTVSFLKYANISFSELTGKLTISTNDTGEKKTLKVSGDFAKALNLPSNSQRGNDTSLSIIPPGEEDDVKGENKKKYTVTSETSNLTIDNISYSVENAKKGSSVIISVNADGTEGVKKIKGFVEKYNKLVEKIQSRLSEKQQFKYKPLMPEQKKSMSKEDAEEWNKKSQQGLLRNSMQLSSLLNDLRGAFYNKVKDAGLMITDLGISTTKNYRDGGKLQIDEKKLKFALENKGEQVQRLFIEKGTEKEHKGVFTIIKERLDKSIGFSGDLIKEAGGKNSAWEFNNALSKRIKEKIKLVEKLEKRMYRRQEELYKQFAQLETAMSQANSQAGYLAGMMPHQ